MGAIYNFCDCKNNDPRLEEQLPPLYHKELLHLSSLSGLSSKKNSLKNFNNKPSNDIIEKIKKKNAINLIIKHYRQHRLKFLFYSSNFNQIDNYQLNNKKRRNIDSQQLNYNFVKNSDSKKDLIGNTIYYIGQKINNQRDGFGLKIMADEAKYIGFFKNNKSEGLGKFITKSYRYYGEFLNDQPNGFGIYCHKDQTIFIGYWENGLRTNFGIESWKDNASYAGEYNLGEKNGIGVYVFGDGSRYEGEWKNNQLEGYGMYFFPGKRIYIGEWKNNVKEGFGEFIWKDKIYIGFYSNDKKNGFGIYFWEKINRAFMGFWKNGKQYGFGKMITKEKIIYGFWIDDKLENSYRDENEAFDELKKLKLNGYKQIFLFNLEDIINYCKYDGIWNHLLEYSNH